MEFPFWELDFFEFPEFPVLNIGSWQICRRDKKKFRIEDIFNGIFFLEHLSLHMHAIHVSTYSNKHHLSRKRINGKFFNRFRKQKGNFSNGCPIYYRNNWQRQSCYLLEVSLPILHDGERGEAQISLRKIRVVIHSLNEIFFKQFKKINVKYLSLEIEDRPDCQELQDALENMTGARSVPRVFIDGKLFFEKKKI